MQKVSSYLTIYDIGHRVLGVLGVLGVFLWLYSLGNKTETIFTQLLILQADRVTWSAVR